MIRTLPIAFLLAVGAMAGCSRPQQGTMSQAELRREPIRFELGRRPKPGWSAAPCPIASDWRERLRRLAT